MRFPLLLLVLVAVVPAVLAFDFWGLFGGSKDEKSSKSKGKEKDNYSRKAPLEPTDADDYESGSQGDVLCRGYLCPLDISVAQYYNEQRACVQHPRDCPCLAHQRKCRVGDWYVCVGKDEQCPK